MLIGFLIPHNKMATLVAFFMRNLPDFKSNSRPLNNGLERNALHIQIQNDLSFSKLFEIWRLDVLWLLGHPTLYKVPNKISCCVL